MRHARPAAGLLLLGLALLVCGVAGDGMMEHAEAAPQHARVQTMVVVHGGRVVGVMQHVQLGRRFGPPELPPGAPDLAAECGQPHGGLSGLLDWAACLVRCMRMRREMAAPHMGAQMGMVHMQMAHAATAAGAAAAGRPALLARTVGGGATPGSFEHNVFDSAAAQQLLGTEPAAATGAAEPEPQAAPWWWRMGHVHRPPRRAEAAEGCRHRHHHGRVKHHHRHHSHEHQHEAAEASPFAMAALHDLPQHHEQRRPRHGNHQLLPGVATPVELIARERAQAYGSRWAELQAAEHTAGSSMRWSLWDASGHLNWGLAAFVALAVACAAVWSAMLAQCTLYRSARANNNAAEVLAAQYHHRVAADEPDAGDADLKPLLREGPVKGAIAATDSKL